MKISNPERPENAIIAKEGETGEVVDRNLFATTISFAFMAQKNFKFPSLITNITKHCFPFVLPHPEHVWRS